MEVIGLGGNILLDSTPPTAAEAGTVTVTVASAVPDPDPSVDDV